MIPCCANERWKPIPVVDLSHYEVSSCGRIRHAGSRKPRKLEESWKGYLKFRFRPFGQGRRVRQKSFFVHRAVALAFVENPFPEDLPLIDHKNGERQQNHAWNLMWADQAMQEARKNELEEAPF